MSSKEFSADLAQQYVQATQGSQPDAAQASRVAKVTMGMTRTLTVTAAESLFDTEPDQLQQTLVALADDEEVQR